MRARCQGPTSEPLNHLTLQANETKRWRSTGSCFLVRMSMTHTTKHGAGKRSHIERISDSRLQVAEVGIRNKYLFGDTTSQKCLLAFSHKFLSARHSPSPSGSTPEILLKERCSVCKRCS